MNYPFELTANRRPHGRRTKLSNSEKGREKKVQFIERGLRVANVIEVQGPYPTYILQHLGVLRECGFPEVGTSCYY